MEAAMKYRMLLPLMLCALPHAHAEDFLKPGLWEVQIVKQIADGKDMSGQIAAAQAQMQQQMAAMSPAQRKQMEQMMGGKLPAQGPNRICISAEMASRDKPMMPPDAQCEPTQVSRSGNTMRYEINCKQDGRTVVGKGESTASADSVISRMDMTMTDARGKHTMQHESRMKYLGSDCQGVVPVDQLAKRMGAGGKP
jgi:hypothetical protein